MIKKQFCDECGHEMTLAEINSDKIHVYRCTYCNCDVHITKE